MLVKCVASKTYRKVAMDIVMALEHKAAEDNTMYKVVDKLTVCTTNTGHGVVPTPANRKVSV